MGYLFENEPDDLFDDTGVIDTGAVRDVLNESSRSVKRYFDDGSDAADPFTPGDWGAADNYDEPVYYDERDSEMMEETMPAGSRKSRNRAAETERTRHT